MRTMRHRITTTVLQHKYIIIFNIVFIFGFVANSALLNGASVGDESSNAANIDEESVALKVYRRKNSGGTEYHHHDSSSESWIIVNLKYVNHMLSDWTQKPLAFLDGIHGWTKVIVGPLTRISHGCTTCMELSNDSPLLSAITRATKQGAKKIYMMTSLHNVTKALIRMQPSEMKGLTYTGKIPFKPCSHYAQPLFGDNRTFGYCYDSNWVYSYGLGDFPEHLVIATCPECDKQTIRTMSNRDGIYCDSSTPNVVVNVGAFTQTEFENSLWTYDSFWAMFFFILNDQTTSLVESLKLSYITQKLLWEMHMSLGFVRSHGLNFKSHGYKSHYKITDDDMIMKICREKTIQSRSLIQLSEILLSWICNSQQLITDCVNNLAGHLYNSKILTARQFHQIQIFITEILSSSYTQLTRGASNIQDQMSQLNFVSRTNSIYFWPSVEKRIWSQNPFHELCETTWLKNDEHSASSFLNSNKGPLMDSIVLVVVFKNNDPATEIQMIQYFDFIYGQHFRHIVYCASGIEMIEMFGKMYPHPMNVINLKTMNPNLFPYVCISEVMKMYHDVKGYVQIDSHTLLNPWSMKGIVRDKLHIPWFSQSPAKGRLSQREVEENHNSNIHWGAWNDALTGRQRFTEALKDLSYIGKTIDEHIYLKNDSIGYSIFKYLENYKHAINKFMTKLHNAMGHKNIEVLYGSSVMYFVPSQYRHDFIVVSDQCCRYTVHADLVVPTLLNTLDQQSPMTILQGTISHNTHNLFRTSNFHPNSVYTFPWQLYLMSGPTRSSFWCDIYLPLLDA